MVIIFYSLPVYGAGYGPVQIISSNEQEVVLELVVPGFQVHPVNHDGMSYQQMSIPDFGLTTDVGTPQVPVRGVVVGVPGGAQPSLEILDTDFKILSNYLPPPVPFPEVIEEGTIGFSSRFTFVRDETIYSQDDFFPSKPAIIGFSGKMRDQNVVQIVFYPIQNNPVRQEVRFYTRIVVRIGFQGSVGGEVPMLEKSQIFQKVDANQGQIKENPYDRMLKSLLLNYP